MKRSIRFESELDDMVSRYVDPKKKERKNFSKTLHYMIKASKQFIEDTGYNFDELMRKGIKITIEREIIRQRLTYEPHRIEKETSQIPYSKEDRIEWILKNCLRNITNDNATDDSYCHKACKLLDANRYKACMELFEESLQKQKILPL